MSSSADYLTFVLDQLSELEGVTHRKMMGEYLLYIHGRLLGGIYDNRLMVKPVPAALALLPGAPQEPPYPGAKPLLVVEQVDERELLTGLIRAMEPELSAPKPKRSRTPKAKQAKKEEPT